MTSVIEKIAIKRIGLLQLRKLFLRSVYYTLLKMKSAFLCSSDSSTIYIYIYIYIYIHKALYFLVPVFIEVT